VFPVTYRRGRTAHVAVTGRRGEAIRQGVRDQLGVAVTEIMPVGLESSAGSTPLRLRVESSPDEYPFAKLYTKGHVRADRWYKLWRTSFTVHGRATSRPLTAAGPNRHPPQITFVLGDSPALGPRQSRHAAEHGDLCLSRCRRQTDERLRALM
jgi:hypothetical protein